MIGRRGAGALIVALSALLVGPSVDGAAAQQSATSRFRVLIPDFQPSDGSSDKFGKKLAEELRERIDELNTHAAVDKDEIKDQLKRFKLDMEDLSCIRARQLAGQSQTQVVLCATYEEIGDKRYRIKDIEFVDVGSGESFPVDPIEVSEKQEAQAAEEIVNRFATFVDQTRFAAFCQQYASSSRWEDALSACDTALELNPGNQSVRYIRANVLRELGRLDESLEEIARILEDNPLHENALLLGGIVAAQVDNPELARDYTRRYLELDPDNAQVRMK
ncbi:MAG: hypothetical protein D6701_12040, partial [Gemmatimonadetes bacterium]